MLCVYFSSMHKETNLQRLLKVARFREEKSGTVSKFGGRMLSLEEKNITQTLILLLYIVYEDAMVEHQDTFFPLEFSNEYHDQTVHFPLNNKNIKIGGCYS